MIAHPLMLAAVLLLPALIGGLTSFYLRNALLRVLSVECGTRERAEFWTRLSSTGMTLAPAALVLMRAEDWLGPVSAVEVALSLLSTTLNGILVVLALLAWALWRSIPAPSRKRTQEVAA